MLKIIKISLLVLTGLLLELSLLALLITSNWWYLAATAVSFSACVYVINELTDMVLQNIKKSDVHIVYIDRHSDPLFERIRNRF